MRQGSDPPPPGLCELMIQMAVPGRRTTVLTVVVVGADAPLPWGVRTWYSPGSALEPCDRAPARVAPESHECI